MKLQAITHAYGHRLADVHSSGFAPAFPLSFHDSECSRKPPMPIASVVMHKHATAPGQQTIMWDDTFLELYPTFP